MNITTPFCYSAECSSPPPNLDPVDKEFHPLHNRMRTISAELSTVDTGDYRPLYKGEAYHRNRNSYEQESSASPITKRKTMVAESTST